MDSKAKTKVQVFIDKFEAERTRHSYDMPVVHRDGGGHSVWCKFYCYALVSEAEGGGGVGVMACLKDCKGKVGLVLIYSQEHKKGYGTRFMNDLCEQADIAGVEIELDPYPQIEGLKVNKLKEWYRRFGFKPSNRKYIRSPR